MNWVQRLNAMLGPQAGVVKNLAAPIFIVTVRSEERRVGKES